MREKPLKYWRILRAAAEVGVPDQTLDSAVRRGDITAHVTTCGLPLVEIAEVRRWVAAADTRRPGRKPAATR